MKKIFSPVVFLLIILLLLVAPLRAQQVQLSNNAEISLLTASPGDELYSVFGHSALRVYDPENKIDLVYNYGTFDFDTPNFYMKFVRGKLLYKLSVVPTEYFLPEYRFAGRAVFEQVLNLDASQRQDIYDFLMVNSRPENAYYHYDFFYDNCATRIRDLVHYILEPNWPSNQEITDESLAVIKSNLNYEYEYQPVLNTGGRSFRDLLQPFLLTKTWSAFGIDLALGLPADKIATPWHYMYLPDEMLIAFALARHANGSPLVSEHRVLLSKTVELSPSFPINPQMVAWFVFAIAVLSFIHPRFSKIFDRVFFTLLGITGLVIVFLWFFTDHISTKGNLNILWALPTHLYFIWYAGRTGTRKTVSLYFQLTTILGILLLVLWPWIPQAYHPAFFPIIFTMVVKSFPYGFAMPSLSRWFSKRKMQQKI